MATGPSGTKPVDDSSGGDDWGLDGTGDYGLSEPDPALYAGTDLDELAGEEATETGSDHSPPPTTAQSNLQVFATPGDETPGPPEGAKLDPADLNTPEPTAELDDVGHGFDRPGRTTSEEISLDPADHHLPDPITQPRLETTPEQLSINADTAAEIQEYDSIRADLEFEEQILDRGFEHDFDEESQPIYDPEAEAAGYRFSTADQFVDPVDMGVTADHGVYQRTEPRERSRWPSFIVAVVAGALLGGGAAFGIFQLVTGRDGESDVAAREEADADTETTGTEAPVTAEDEVAPPPLVADGRANLNSIRFSPGTTELTSRSEVALEELAAAMIESPDVPLLVTVRTYSEPTAAQNLVLSEQQATAVVDHLAGAGADVTDAVAIGVGNPPLSVAQPVQNFVFIDQSFGGFELQEVLSGGSPYAVGLDPATNELRPESFPYLERLGQAMTDDPGTTIGVAGYSLDRRDQAGNRSFASAAVDAVREFLATRYEIAGERVSGLTLGQATHIVPDQVGNHVSVQWGEQIRTASAVAEIEQDAIGFESGSPDLTTASRAVLDSVAQIAAGSDEIVVIDTHTYSEIDPETNRELSETQSEAVAFYLLEAGVPSDRLRWHGSGSSRQFQDDDRSNRVVISVIR